jgi:hypothetical protein
VIATFIIDWPVLGLIGIVFGIFAPSERWWSSRAFYGGLVTAGVFTATALISYAIAPDWMWMYFIDPSDVAWSVPLIAVGYLFVFVLGFGASVALAGLGRKAQVAAVVTCLLGEIAVIAVTWDRYHLVGTREEFVSGSANLLVTASPQGDARTIGLMGPVFIAVLVISLIVVRRGARAAATDR